SEVNFRDVIEHMQLVQLKLDGLPVDTSHRNKFRIVVDRKSDNDNVRFAPRQEIISTINVLRDKFRDSLRQPPEVKGGMVISLDKNFFVYKHDSTKPFHAGIP